MHPSRLAAPDTEAAHQTALFAWAAYAHHHGFDAADEWDALGAPSVGTLPDVPKVPELRWLHHIPNGGSRGDSTTSRAINGARLKQQGVKVGVSDIFLPARRGRFSGLYIEMKKPALRPKRGGRGGVSEEQEEFGKFVQSQGFGFMVCYSWEEARDAIVEYLTWLE